MQTQALERGESLVCSACIVGGLIASMVTGQSFCLVAGGLVAMAFRIAWARGTYTPSGRFGAANTLTLARVGVISCLGLMMPAIPRVAFSALVAGLIALDGVDGWVARRTGSSSAFGQKFDMEADAFMVIVLCALLALYDIVGDWVLIAGLWRYAYAAIVTIGSARGQVPRSQLGRVACGVLMAALAGAFLPLAWMSPVLAATGTLVISASFVRSLAWSFGLLGSPTPSGSLAQS